MKSDDENLFAEMQLQSIQKQHLKSEYDHAKRQSHQKNHRIHSDLSHFTSGASHNKHSRNACMGGYNIVIVRIGLRIVGYVLAGR
jgi:hypothetical protein